MGKRGPAKSFRNVLASRHSSGDSAGYGPPDYLDAEALAEWNRVYPWLESRGLTSSTDREMLATYCVACQMVSQAWQKSKKEGMVIRGARGGFVKNPLLAIISDASKIMNAISARFGFTPADRAGMKITERVSTNDPREKLFDIVG